MTQTSEEPLLQTTQSKSIARLAFEEAIATPEATADTAMKIMDVNDVVGWTFVRLFQVFGNIFANGSNSDQYSANSVFNRLIYKDPLQPALGMTTAGWVLTGGGLATMTMGLLRRIYQIYHQKELNSYAYLQARLQEAAAALHLDEEYTQDRIEAGLERILRSGQLNVIRPAKKARVGIIATAINKVRELGISRAIGAVWDFLGYQSMVFWIAFMPVSLMAGSMPTMVAAAMPVILGITAVVGGGLYLYHGLFKGVAALYHWITNSEEDASEVHDQVLLNQLKQRYFVEQLHALKMQALFRASGREVEPVIPLLPPASEYELARGETVIRLRRIAPQRNQRIDEMREAEPNDVLDSRLAQYLLESKTKRTLRRRVNIIADIWNAFITMSFVMWLVSALATAAVPVIGLAGLAAFLSGSMQTLIPCIVSGFFAGLSAFADATAKQADYEKKVYERLNATLPGHNVKTGEYFETLEQELKRHKDQVTLLRHSVKTHDIHADTLCDLEKMNPYNDYYFEKQKIAPSATSLLKKGMNRAYSLVGGGQSGILMARMLFLTSGFAVGGVLATTGVLAMPVFLAIAAVGCVSVGVLKLVQYQFERDLKHREDFVDNIEVRIQSMENNIEELKQEQTYLRGLLNRHAFESSASSSTSSLLSTLNVTPLRRRRVEASNDVTLPRPPSDRSMARRFTFISPSAVPSVGSSAASEQPFERVDSRCKLS